METTVVISTEVMIIQLITDDLKYYKLWNVLSICGNNTIPFHSNIQEAVFYLLGFRNPDQINEIREWYFSESDKALIIESSDNESFSVLAKEILNGLTGNRLIS